MKTTVIAAALLITATSASAIELGATGISIGAEVDANYTTGVEEFAFEVTPEASFTNWGIDFSASTTMNLMDLNEDDADLFTGVDLEAGYSITNSLRAYGEISTDADFEFGDATVGVTFSF